jgi:hypothetical protein
MHASIALFLMMLGGPVLPDLEIVTVPLKEDLSNPTAMQELEWKEMAKRHPLPAIPTARPDDRSQVGEDGRSRYPVPPTDRLAPRPTQPVMPAAPTSAEAQRTMPNMPYQPGGGTPPAQFGGGTAPGTPPPFNAGPARNPINNGYSGFFGAPGAAPAPSVSTYTSNYTNALQQNAYRFGLGSGSPNPATDKPFANYQPPSGYSPWSNLMNSTANGMVNPYNAYVQPLQNQQNVNQRMSEQINGVQTMQRGYGVNTPGSEVPTGGGMANPSIYLNYKGYFPTY